ncbi:GbsR/MarR family transcriptional regulator [Sinosporangium siamense]|uniref:MarR family transcriptional regulator n=1 Tax=Sinosporangium siamense TaxID=1367973 RepID=A0A919VE34_9ACTN|nr:helix-turn-helix domain-containing protein [Sinosporangium siamense]GII94729.1 MarR family transcriptional regulator [Sinosporangium siamense]
MSGQRLTQQDRRQIAAGLRDGLTYAAIARRLGRPTSTVTREVMRNGGPGGYHADRAHLAGKRPVRRHGTTPATRPGSGDLDGRDPRVVDEVAAQSAELMVRAGLPLMMAKVMAALFTTDSGSLTSADLVRRLRVSPASISKAVGYLESQELIKRERDPRRRAERYVVDDTIWLQAIMASVRINYEIATACEHGAQRLGPGTPAGVRLESMGRFLSHVSDDLVRSTEHWHRVCFPDSP